MKGEKKVLKLKFVAQRRLAVVGSVKKGSKIKSESRSGSAETAWTTIMKPCKVSKHSL